MSDRLALLERAQQGDDRAEAQLLTENAGLIWSIVRRYNGCGVETDDLYQLGCIGFVKAVKGFDLTYGTQFSTYAVPIRCAAHWWGRFRERAAASPDPPA